MPFTMHGEDDQQETKPAITTPMGSRGGQVALTLIKLVVDALEDAVQPERTVSGHPPLQGLIAEKFVCWMSGPRIGGSR